MQRWQHPEGRDGDRRVAGLHEQWEPTNKLSQTEREAAIAMLNGDEFKNLPPSQIVPRLADQGRYIASESTLYRLLHQAGQMRPPVFWRQATTAAGSKTARPCVQWSGPAAWLRLRPFGRCRVAQALGPMPPGLTGAAPLRNISDL